MNCWIRSSFDFSSSDFVRRSTFDVRRSEFHVRTIRLTLQYDGTDFVGWQRQAAGTSIQGLLEDALLPIEGKPVVVHGAGRTDAGVHALGQVASFGLEATIEPPTLAKALNAVLPLDVRVAEAETADAGFHARFSSTGKVYEYRILNGRYASPFLRRYALHVIPPLDVEAMRQGAVTLVGEHDFSAFQGTGSQVHTPVRTIRRCDWREGNGPDTPLVLEIEGDGFLRHMVRNIVGTLLDVGLRRRAPAEIGTILASGSRSRAGNTAPPHGLFLQRVLYGRPSLNAP
jgi:tRNA pseudouridine38-40 synthase